MRSHFSLSLRILLLATIASALPLRAQSVPPAEKPLAFDVISIKPSDPNTKLRRWGVQPTMFMAQGMPLSITIDMAFVPRGYPARDMLQGVPAWAATSSSNWYDIEGKFDENTTQAFTRMTVPERQENIKPLLQKLLVDRCKLVFHREPIEIQGFALVVSKGGAKLQPAVEGEAEPDRAVTLASGGKMVPFVRGQQPAVLQFFHATMGDLVRQLAMGVPIIDQTGISGQFNFGVPRTDQENSGIDMDADAFTRAHFLDLTPLGLELKPIKVPVDKIVIDSIEKPSTN